MWVPLALTSRFICGPLPNTKVFQCSIDNRSFSFCVADDHRYLSTKLYVNQNWPKSDLGRFKDAHIFVERDITRSRFLEQIVRTQITPYTHLHVHIYIYIYIYIYIHTLASARQLRRSSSVSHWVPASSLKKWRHLSRP